MGLLFTNLENFMLKQKEIGISEQEQKERLMRVVDLILLNIYEKDNEVTN